MALGTGRTGVCIGGDVGDGGTKAVPEGDSRLHITHRGEIVLDAEVAVGASHPWSFAARLVKSLSKSRCPAAFRAMPLLKHALLFA
ncbi:MAG: hypothetical protein GY811_01290 [Myxococcales bacterium]|nr:hypothetical protein [Myxococcales bacterium]